jgi:hypothetical protein
MESVSFPVQPALLPLPEGVLEHEYIALRLTKSELGALDKDIAGDMDKDGLWTKPISGDRGAYPNVLRRTYQHAKREVLAKERKSAAVMYTCSHVRMIAAGNKPPLVGVQASHLCHNTKCLKVSHLVWEYRYQNLKRNRCINLQACTCGQVPACMPTVHASK